MSLASSLGMRVIIYLSSYYAYATVRRRTYTALLFAMA